MPLERIVYTDESGRKKVVLLPEDSKDSDPSIGIPIGPPSFEDLGLPLEVEVRLSNELFHRNILTAQDAIKRRSEVLLAIQAALRVDAEKVLGVYLGNGHENARIEKQELRAEPRANVNRPPRRNRNRPVRT